MDVAMAGGSQQDWFSYGTTSLGGGSRIAMDSHVHRCGKPKTFWEESDCENDNPARLIHAMKKWNATVGDRPSIHRKAPPPRTRF
jgi:hypothetical protein